MEKSIIGESIFTIDFVLEKLRNKGETNCIVENLESFEAEVSSFSQLRFG